MDKIKRIVLSKTPNFFSKEMIIKKTLKENPLKYTYQKQLISDPKHKVWSNFAKSFKSFR